MMKHYNQVIIALTQFQEKKIHKGPGPNPSYCRQGVPTPANQEASSCADKESPPQPIRKLVLCEDRSPHPSQSQLNRQDLNQLPGLSLLESTIWLGYRNTLKDARIKFPKPQLMRKILLVNFYLNIHLQLF